MSIPTLLPNTLTNTGFTYTPSEDKLASSMESKLVLSNGSDEFWIIWKGGEYVQLENGELYQPRYIQKFGVDGVVVGSAMQLPQFDNSMYPPKYSLITSSTSDDRLVYMARESDNEEGYHFSGHIVDSDGTANSFYYENPSNEYISELLDVIPSGDNKFLITWRGESYHSDSLNSSVFPIFAQQFDSDGSVAGDVIRLPEFDYYTGAMSNSIQYVYLSDPVLGDRLIYAGFEYDDSANSYFIKGQIVDGAGVLISEFQYTPPQNARYDYFEVVSNGGREFWVAWWGESVLLTEGGTDYFNPHYAQQFDIYGNIIGDVVRLPNYSDSYQYNISLALVSDPIIGDSLVSVNTRINHNLNNTIFEGKIVDSNGESILSGVVNNAGGIVNGNSDDNQLIVNADTTNVFAGDGFDTAIFSGNYADYTFIPAYSSLKSYDSTESLTNINGVERLQFDDGIVDLILTGSGEMQVNTTTSSHQFSPNTAAFSDGGFVVVWASKNVDDYSVNAQIFDSNGDPSGSELIIATGLTKDQATPSVAVSSEDSYAISYGEKNNGLIKIYNNSNFSDAVGYTFEGDIKEFGNDGFVALKDSYQITYYDSSLNAVGTHGSSAIDYGYNYIGNDNYIFFGDQSSGTDLTAFVKGTHLNTSVFQINTYSMESYGADSTHPVAAGLTDEGFVVVWQSRNLDTLDGSISATVDDVKVDVTIGLNNQDLSGYGIYAQRYDYDANPVGTQFLINTYSDNHQTHPDIVGLSDGGFVVVWESYAQDGSLSGIYGQRYDVDGNVEGGEFKVSNYYSSHQDDPSVTALANGGFVVSWESFGQDGSGDGIFAKVYDADGNPLPTMSLGEINDTAPMLASFTMLNNVNENTSTINEAPLYFDTEIVSAYQASNAIYGENLSTNPSEKLIKLTLNADITKLTDDSINSIAATGLDIGLDWGEFEVVNYTGGSNQWFDSKNNTNNFFNVRKDISTEKLESVVVSSLDVSSASSLTLVDSIETNAAGQDDHPSVLNLGDIYLNPINTIDSATITYGGGVVTNQGDGQFVQATKSMVVDTSPVDVVISTGNNKLLVNTNLDAYKDGLSQNVSTPVTDSGEMWFHQSVNIDEVKTSDADVYNFDTSINISDAIDVLRHIVDLESFTPGSVGYHAADVNNDGNINISDAIDILRHIVNLEAIDTFDILDMDGSRVTQFDANVSADVPTWTIVANGDVNASGEFASDYVMADIV